MMEYKFVQGVNYFDIVAKVEQELRNGWKLAGGISVCAVSDTDVRFTQALTKVPAVLETFDHEKREYVRTPVSIPEPSVTPRPDTYYKTISERLPSSRLEVTDIYENPVPEPRWAKLDEKDGTWSPAIPVPDPVAPKSDQQKLIDVLTEIGIPHQVHYDPACIACVDIVGEGTQMFTEGWYTSVNFNHDGTFRNLD